MITKQGEQETISPDSKRGFARDERGQITILGLIFFVMLMAVGGLAIDMGRLYSLQGQIQTYVDDAALASASQLDHQPGAICRAISAAVGPVAGNPLCTANGLVTGQQYFAAGSHQLAVQQIMFLSTLGPDPGARAATPTAQDSVVCTLTAPLFDVAPCLAVVNADKITKFVEIRDNPEQISFLVLPIMRLLVGSAVTQETIGLKATAGYRSQVCDTTPMMICNPEESPANLDTNFPYTPIVGQQIMMKASGGGAWAPGDFGWLSPPNNAGGTECNTGNGSQVRCMLALVNPLTQCLDDNNVGVQPGSSTSTQDGLNVRFDIYTGNFGSGGGQSTSNPDFAPSVNVAKGICKKNGSNCNYSGNAACPSWGQINQDTQDSSHALISLPRDADIYAADVASGSEQTTLRFGNGTWAISDPALCPGALTGQQCYWQINHGGSVPGAVANATRYKMYRYEIDNNLIPNNGIPNKSGASGEDGRPRCNTSVTDSSSGAFGVNDPNRDRRTLLLAVVNCHAWGLSGNSQKSVSIVAMVKMFLTEPVGLDYHGVPSGSANNVYGEVVQTIKPGDTSGVLHQFPVLYR